MKYKISALFLMYMVGFSLSLADVNNLPEKTKLIQLTEKLGTAENINVNFYQADIKDVINFFATEFNMNIILSSEVKRNLTFTFKNINPALAFNAILSSNNLDWNLENNIITVYQQQPMKVYKLNYMKADTLAKTLQDLIKDQFFISLNKESNSIIINAPENVLENITKLIKNLDTPPYQVLAEVKILEVQEGFTEAIGINLAKDKGANNSIETKGFTTDVSNSNSGLFVQIIKDDITSVLQALQTKNNLDILATPKILAINHQEAIINTSQRLGYKTTQSSSTTGLVTETINFLEVGTKLTFTPHISETGDIIMEIKPEISEGSIATGGIPNASSTQTNTAVMVKDGETILIGGLIRNKKLVDESGVPILANIPVLDLFFKGKKVTNQKVETIVLITPHLIKPNAQ